MSIDAVMSQERWDALTDIERTLLGNLGVHPIAPKKEKITNPITLERRLSTRNTAPTAYFTQIHSTCGCCRDKVVKEGKMDKRRVTDNHLSFISGEIPDGEEYKRLKVVSTTCTKCDVVLSELSKEELITMVIVLRETAARKCAI